ncbi:MAG: hypothetical protein IE932_16060 [Sphingopyxis terrae]|nr:hypothetical protein [Sphingopyxis terrae]
MSYDLMVFDPAVAPRDRAGFMSWYGELTAWGEEHSYDDVSITTDSLRRWYTEMLTTFPAMNGPDAADRPYDSPIWDDPHLTDYSIARHAIYCAFSWSVGEKAFSAVTRLAAKHGVGFFDVSADAGKIHFPDGLIL